MSAINFSHRAHLLSSLLFSVSTRDSTVQSLTTQPSVEEGKIVYKDSPLVGDNSCSPLGLGSTCKLLFDCCFL